MPKAGARVKNLDEVIGKVQDRIERLAPNSANIKKALTMTATLISAQAKLNVRRHSLIDTGRLINSLRWEFIKRGSSDVVQIGSFGVPYAAFWEFGYKGTMSVRAHNRVITRAFGKPLDQAVIARVRAHQRQRFQEAKPYLMPAYERHKRRVIEFLKQV